MMPLVQGTQVWLACRPTDMRKGIDGLVAQVKNVLAVDPFSGHLFVFRGKRGDYLKILYWDGSGLCLFAKRLERSRFVWPPVIDERLHLTRGSGSNGTENRHKENLGGLFHRLPRVA